jgi:putative tricarboxylic transport membrane protein
MHTILTWRAAACAAILFVYALAPAGAQQWKPMKNVEIVVGSAPGGSPDVMARLVQSIFQQRGLLPVSAAVVNKPGAANTIGWAYLNQHAGDAHFIATYSATRKHLDREHEQLKLILSDLGLVKQPQ